MIRGASCAPTSTDTLKQRTSFPACSVCDYEGITKSYAPACQYYILRAVSASFSTLTCPAMYLAARLLGEGTEGLRWVGTRFQACHQCHVCPLITDPGASPLGGILAAGLLIFDGLAVGEGRYVLVRDGVGGGSDSEGPDAGSFAHSSHPPLPSPDGQPAHLLARRRPAVGAGMVSGDTRPAAAAVAGITVLSPPPLPFVPQVGTTQRGSWQQQ